MNEIRRKTCVLLIVLALNGKDRNTKTALDEFLKEQASYMRYYTEEDMKLKEGETHEKDTLEVYDQLDNRYIGRIRKIKKG